MTQPAHDDVGRLHEAANRLTRWTRGDAALPDVADGALEVVVDDGAAIEWLCDPATGLVGASTMVFLTSRPAGRVPDTALGTWMVTPGGVTDPGDEVALSRDLYVQTADYASVRYLSVVGPTIVRVGCAEDALDFLAGVDAALGDGEFPQALVHPLVELADRCALSGGGDCHAAELTRIHVDCHGDVRSAPGGRVLGRVGDTAVELRVAARGHDGDVCLGPEAATLIAAAGGERLTAYLAALDALRTLILRDPGPWRVSGFGRRLVTSVGAVASPRSDLLVLTDEREFILWQSLTRRAFRIDRRGAEAIEAILDAPDASAAAERLRENGSPGIGASELEAVRTEFGRRGVDLQFAGA